MNPKVCFAGKSLVGSVDLNVSSTIRKTKGWLYAYGKEKVAIRTPGPSAPAAERQFFSFRQELPDLFPGQSTVQPGLYRYPFSIQLPACLPSSDKFPSDQSKKGYRIQYKIKAIFGNKEKAWYFSVVSAGLPDERVPAFIRPQTFEVTGAAGLMKKGKLLLAASIEDAHIGRGQELYVDLSCRNFSKVDITRVQVSLLERMKWKVPWDDELSEDYEHVLFLVNDIDLPKLNKGKKHTSQIQDELVDQNLRLMYENMYRDLADGSNKLRVPIRYGTRDTFAGTLVQVEHFLKIKLQTPRGVSNPSVEIPIRIGTRPYQSANSTVIPAAVTSATLVPVPTPRLNRNEGNIANSCGVPLPMAPTEGCVPLVSATAIPGTVDIEAPIFEATASAINLGGDAILGASTMSVDYAGLVPLAPPGHSTEPSLPRLYDEMVASVDDFDIITGYLQNDGWRELFENVTPEEYGMIITYVTMDFDQPRVASLLASHVNGGILTCQYVAAAVRGALDVHKATMVQRLAPRCVDLGQNGNLISNELSEWDRIITQRSLI